MRNIIARILLFAGTSTWAQTLTVNQKIASLPGTYKHKRPCKNCTGVENTLTLYCKVPVNGGNYSYKEEYINSINGDHSSEVTGRWKIVDTAAGLDESSIIIGLTANNKPGKTEYYMLGNGSMEQLDPNKKQIDPPFNLVLKKQ